MESKIKERQLSPTPDITNPMGDEDFKAPSFETRNGFVKRKEVLRLHFAIIHIFGIIGLVMAFQGRVMLSTLIFAEATSTLCHIGVGAGAHRLFAHRSYKAKTPLRALLAILFAFAGQQSLWLWTAWHRVHHKLTDTDADPHNSTRGFFYSHIGWLLTYDHDKFMENYKKIDMSDMENDPIVMFHERYYDIFHLVCIFIIPTLIPWYILGESLFLSFCVGACFRHCSCSHKTFLVNSVAHLWGYRPYDTSISSAENKLVSFLALGEGWHNYHHVFPWDYKTAELGPYRWNISAAFIDFCAWFGWAYDLKSAGKEAVGKRVARTGNHLHLQNGAW